MMLANRVARDLNPWRVLHEIEQQFNRQVGDWIDSAVQHWTRGSFRLWTGDGSAVLELDLPGVAPDAIDVSVHKNVLTIETKPAEPVAEDAVEYHLRERTPAERREFRLPFEVDSQKTEADYRHGILRLTLHQPESHRPARIAVRAN
jgi:HSP20 family protein